MPEKMKISAAICELNPFHGGHGLLFARAKADADALVCVLSGNFVERGDIAILDKWDRTRLALSGGADLVIELPLPWALSGAEGFASGGVALLTALGNVDALWFGCETADTSLLLEIAQTLRSPDYEAALRAQTDAGDTFALRREKALTALLGEKVRPVLRAPNAILGVEYCKALLKVGGRIAPKAVLRRGAAHDGPLLAGTLPSAGALRERFLQGEDVSPYLPKSTQALLSERGAQGAFPYDLKRLEIAILCKLRICSPQDLLALPDMDEGLAARFCRAARSAGTLEEFLSAVKTRHYPLARIRRGMLRAFLDFPTDLPAMPPYLRVLGMTDAGERVLSAASPALPLVLRPRDAEALSPEARAVFGLEVRADDVYALAAPTPRPCGRDLTEKLLRA